MKYAEQLQPEIAQERAQWPTVMKDVDPKHLHFLDESCAKTIMTRLYGRARRGQRVIDYVPDGRWESWTMLGALTALGAGPMLTYSGGTDVATMTTYVTECLAPTLGAGDVVVMDNLSAHKHADVVTAIEATGAKVCFLPRYSPDLNPIELMWSKIKTYLRKAKARTTEALITAIREALETITATDALNWLRHCGYGVALTL